MANVSTVRGRIVRGLQRALDLGHSRSFYRRLFIALHASAETALVGAITGDVSLSEGSPKRPLDLSGLRRLLVVTPHCDDEAIGAGGLMLRCAAAGVRVDVLYFTDSSVGTDEEARAASASVRAAEADAACHLLRAHRHDFGISCAGTRLEADVVDRFRRAVDDLAPDAIAVPWLLDRPSQHRMLNHVLALAVDESSWKEARLLAYQVHSPVPANRILDITDVIEQKRELLKLYRSQLEIKAFDHVAIGMAAYNSRFFDTRAARYAEIFFEIDAGRYAAMVRDAYERDLRAVYGARPDTLLLMSELVRSRSTLSRNQR